MRNRYFLLVAAAIFALAIAGNPSTAAQDNPTLQPGARVHDETGTSLTTGQIADLERRLASLAATGPDAVVVVRNLMATPDETLDQVEALQQEWAAANGIDDDLAVAILINRNPDNPNDARAGIYVGSALDDGNIPENEQRAIVDEELIPPLREGDVYTSLLNGITRLESSYLYGPPQSRFERWAEDASESWLTPAGLIVSALLAGATGWLFRKRETRAGLELPPSTQRPDGSEPAIGGTLATGGPQASAIPATILSLAERGHLVFEQESEGSRFTKPTLGVRLIAEPQSALDRVVWNQLVDRAENGVVSNKNLQKIAADTRPTRDFINGLFREQGWVRSTITQARGGIVVLACLAAILAIVSFIITVVGGNWVSVVSAVALAAACLLGIWCYAHFSPFTRAGQEVAAPWVAYRSGVSNALKQQSTPLDLNAVLADAVAMNLGSKAGKRVEAAQDAGVVLNAFAGSNLGAAFPVWIAFNASVASTSGSGSATVSSSGAGGGGGAAGST